MGDHHSELHDLVPAAGSRPLSQQLIYTNHSAAIDVPRAPACVWPVEHESSRKTATWREGDYAAGLSRQQAALCTDATVFLRAAQ